MKPSSALKNAAIAFIVAYGLITVYRLFFSYDFFECLFNPVGCATQGAVLQLVSMVELVINPLLIVVLSILYFVAKKRGK